MSPPLGGEVSIREGKNSKLLFLLNHTEKEINVKVPSGFKELLGGKKTTGKIKLGRFGNAVIKLK